jgi:hypothetical protein
MSSCLRLPSLLLICLLLSGCQWVTHRWPWHHGNASIEQQQKKTAVQALLAKGNLAFDKDRLSVPAEDNAVLYYKQALSLDANNGQAKKGLSNVAKRYCALGMTANSNGDRHLAEKYLRRAEDIIGVTDDTNALRQHLQEVPAGKNPRNLQLKRPAATIVEKHKPVEPDATSHTQRQPIEKESH